MCASQTYAQGRNEGATAQREQSASEQQAAWKTPNGANYRQRCEQPESHNDADLCQQWRSANAAEETAKYARLSYFWSIVQAIGLLVTLALSGIATILSVRALWIAERDLTEREKPVLHLGDIRTIANQSSFVFQFSLQNIGEKAAKIESIELAISAPRFAPHPLSVSRASDGWAFVEHQNRLVRVSENERVGVTRLKPFSDAEWSQIVSEGDSKACFMFGYILYRDQMNHRRRRSVCVAAWGNLTPGRSHVHVYQGRYYDEDKRVNKSVSWVDTFRVWISETREKDLERREAKHSHPHSGA